MIRLWLHLFFVLTWLGFWEPAEARRARFKPTPPKTKKSEAEKTIEKLAPGQNINIDQMSGKWYLLTVASRCKNLLESGKVESTIVTRTVTGEKVSVSTVRKLNFECWEIKQNYMETKTPGQLFLQGKRPAENVDIMVLETDSYATVVFKRAGEITMKLYGRSSEVPDNILEKI
ncbi:complement component C8 gamma chain-like [Sinocyclocheilus rhinocerous]|uniref:complement component C8 gamma chain-like n=1 Tax=Sinocyclocheilus rhinocerous TaxID=307959 RepID=UPI0007B887F0|nr:PREDICTED: complement component C8 gamma chain-like [Sinocyclocheilus rhinocerous]XP_016410159.1 PREDICTED: complement component C8 gamma chain-like [Sinocyclocheilus rhinocerous]